MGKHPQVKVKKPSLFKTLWLFLDTNRLNFLFWNIPIIISNVFSLVQPLIIGAIIDFFTKYKPEQSLNTFYYYLAFLLAGSVIVEILRVSARGAMFGILSDLEYHVKTKGFENIQNNTLDWNQKENTGNRLQRLETGKTALLDFVGLIKDDIFYIAISLVGIVGVFFAIDKIYLVFFIVYVVIQSLQIKFWDRKNPEYLNRLNSAKEQSLGKLFEGLSNIQTVKSLGVTASVQKSINNAQHELRSATMAWERLGVFKWTSVGIVDLIFLSAFFFLLGHSVISNKIGVGFIYVLYTYFDKLQSITKSMANKYSKFVEIKSNIERMIPLFEVPIQNKGTNIFPKEWQSINLSNACFEYETDKSKAVFNDIDFNVTKGDFVGITGESGSGKSSILKVLLGLYPLKSGQYNIGNEDFYAISSQEVLENMTVVLQETELFNVSLLENITMFQPVDVERLEKAIQVACLQDIIKELPDGLETIVGEKGTKLSGGQRQRIGIARAIYKNSQILLLDEATSNLDYEMEEKVMRGIREQIKDVTIIAVAHRISTLENANAVYKMGAGKLAITKI